MKSSLPSVTTALEKEGIALDEATIERIIDYFDMSADGEVDKDEFTSAGMLLMVKSMFDLYDINKDGTIDEMEFYQALMGSICVDNMPNRIKLTLTQLDLAKNPSIPVFDLLDNQRVNVDQDFTLVVITIWVQREENRFYKAEFPIKVTNRETENQRKSPEKTGKEMAFHSISTISSFKMPPIWSQRQRF